METKVLDKSRLMANVLMVVLVAMNIFFSIQYTSGIRNEDKKIEQEAQRTEERIETARFMKFFIDKVLGTNGIIAFDDRVKLEADVRALGDEQLLSKWNDFVNSKGSEEAQKAAVTLMSLLSNKMI